ncbi:MAG: hypothetical protein IT475_10185 [Aquimonas sp.]|jgi:hypothetical protein|nr:hypothetical protein [Aquimonas sp.]
MGGEIMTFNHHKVIILPTKVRISAPPARLPWNKAFLPVNKATLFLWNRSIGRRRTVFQRKRFGTSGIATALIPFFVRVPITRTTKARILNIKVRKESQVLRSRFDWVQSTWAARIPTTRKRALRPERQKTCECNLYQFPQHQRVTTHNAST